MNRKISEVTKLYDQLLDRQVSQTRWRPEALIPNTYPIRSDSYPQTSTWHAQPHPPVQTHQAPVPITLPPVQVYVQQPQMSPPQQAIYSPPQTVPPQQLSSPAPAWNSVQTPLVSQPWLGSQQQPQLQQQQASDVSMVSSPINANGHLPPPMIVDNRTRAQNLQPPQAQQIFPQQQVPTKAPSASPAYNSPPTSTLEQSYQHPAVQPAVRPIAQSPPSVYAAQTSVPPPQQTAVPLFPSVPQAEPQTFEPYNAHTSTLEPERREALLIDL